MLNSGNIPPQGYLYLEMVGEVAVLKKTQFTSSAEVQGMEK